MRNHVRRDVDPVDVEAFFDERHQESACAAAQVQHRFAKCPYRGAIELELLRLGEVELGPPAGNQAVVPRGDARILAYSN